MLINISPEMEIPKKEEHADTQAYTDYNTNHESKIVRIIYILSDQIFWKEWLYL